MLISIILLYARFLYTCSVPSTYSLTLCLSLCAAILCIYWCVWMWSIINITKRQMVYVHCTQPSVLVASDRHFIAKFVRTPWDCTIFSTNVYNFNRSIWIHSDYTWYSIQYIFTNDSAHTIQSTKITSYNRPKIELHNHILFIYKRRFVAIHYILHHLSLFPGC